jgi:hypothetical protein
MTPEQAARCRTSASGAISNPRLRAAALARLVIAAPKPAIVIDPAAVARWLAGRAQREAEARAAAEQLQFDARARAANCAGKVAHATRRDAEKVMARGGYAGCLAYRCDHCGEWHLGRTKAAALKRNPRRSFRR